MNVSPLSPFFRLQKPQRIQFLRVRLGMWSPWHPRSQRLFWSLPELHAPGWPFPKHGEHRRIPELWQEHVRLVPLCGRRRNQNARDLCASVPMPVSCSHVAQWSPSRPWGWHSQPHSLCPLEWKLLSLEFWGASEGLPRRLPCVPVRGFPWVQSEILHRWASGARLGNRNW
jgi:hypothetical protein